jgi:hypothetical protein
MCLSIARNNKNRAPREVMLAAAAAASLGGRNLGATELGKDPQATQQNQSLVDDPEIWGSSTY